MTFNCFLYTFLELSNFINFLEIWSLEATINPDRPITIFLKRICALGIIALESRDIEIVMLNYNRI